MKREEERYFYWLCDSVDADDNHGKLLRYLYGREFTWTVSMDANRAGDGLWLRREYAEEVGLDISDIVKSGKPCSMLEMFVALAKRCEDYLAYDWEIGDRTGEWFWTWMDNMGLGYLTDDDFTKEEIEADAEDIVSIFLAREYENGGFGCPFVFEKIDSKTFKNVRKMEIWDQVNKFFEEIL